MLRFLRRLLVLLCHGGAATPPRRERPSALRRPEDYIDLLRGHPGVRVTTVRLLTGAASRDGLAFRREHIETEDDEGNVRQVDLVDSRTCDFGHWLDRDVRLTAVCGVCGALLCSSEGCTGRCCVCGIACCQRDRVTYELGDGKTVTYCARCRWRHWWRLWWGLYP